MSAICTEFVQNAWKKDLCSNCFKAKSDHAGVQPATVSNGQDASGPATRGEGGGPPQPLTKGEGKQYASPTHSSTIGVTRTVPETKSEVTVAGCPLQKPPAVPTAAPPDQNNKSYVQRINNNNNNNNDVVVAANNQLNTCGNPRFIKNKPAVTNGGSGHPSLRKIGSSGAHLWEVGHLPDKGTSLEYRGVNGQAEVKGQAENGGTTGTERASIPSVNGSPMTSETDLQPVAVPGILKDTKTVENGSATKNRLHFGGHGGGGERRGSVGFIDESPQVIGYGGHDYEWDDHESDEDCPSDLDSLENFDMTEEDRDFCRLTDRNTEYNSDNTNLLTTTAALERHPPLPIEDATLPPVPVVQTEVAAPPALRSFHRVLSETDFRLQKNGRQDSKEKIIGMRQRSERSCISESDTIRFDYLEDDGDDVQVDEDDEDDGTMVERSCEPDSNINDVPLAEPDSSDATTTATPTTMAATSGTGAAGYRAGSVTVPARKHPSVPRTSVLRLFNEEPVTTAELQAALDASQPLNEESCRGRTLACHLPGNEQRLGSRQSTGCSPYGVVQLSSLHTDRAPGLENRIYGSSQAPSVPTCPPPASDDESQKLPLSIKSARTSGGAGAPFGLANRFQPHAPISRQSSAPLEQGARDPQPSKHYSGSGKTDPKSTVGMCSTFSSPLANESTEPPRFWNREYATVNYSCHYAASYVATPLLPQSDVHSGKLASGAALPPTPLTNPYSSTAILKGLPQQQRTDTPEQSPQRPPVTKPKPKLPAKPLMPQRSSSSEEASSVPVNASELEVDSVDNSTSNGTTRDTDGSVADPHLCNSERAEDPVLQRSSLGPSGTEAAGDPDAAQHADQSQGLMTSFESKVATLSGSLDFSKRTPKRQAPRPPTTAPQSNSLFQAMNGDRVSITSTVSDDSVVDRRLSGSAAVAAFRGSSSLPARDRYSASSKFPATNGVATPLILEHASRFGSSLSNTDPGPGSNRGLSLKGTAATSMSTSSLNGVSYEGGGRTSATKVAHKEGKLKRSKFSLKKLWKFGSKDDGDDGGKSKGKGLGPHFANGPQQPERRGKLEILHPIDLIKAGTAIQDENTVLSVPPVDRKQTEMPVAPDVNGHVETALPAEAVPSTYATVLPRDEVTSSEMIDSQGDDCKDASSVGKPPPPPRYRCAAEDLTKDRPTRPPPPSKTKHQEFYGSQEDLSDPAPSLRHRKDRGIVPQSQEQRNSYYSSTMEYANLGDVRNTLTPKKPGRCPSNSMIDAFDQHSVSSTNEPESQDESIGANTGEGLRSAVDELRNDESLYSESLGENLTAEMERRGQQEDPCNQEDDGCVQQAEHGPTVSNVAPILMSVSQQQHLVAQHANGIETLVAQAEQRPSGKSQPPEAFGKSDGKKIYERVVLKKGNLEKVYAKLPVASLDPSESNVPSTAISDMDDGDSGTVSLWPRRKSSRLSLRKAKTVVHKNLEDNYGAVVTANHQTLTQILEQVSLTQPGMASKARLLEEVPPHWADFKLLEDCQVTLVRGKAFFSAVWQQNVELTLMASQEPLCVASQSTRNLCVLTPFVEFEDAIPLGYFLKTGDLSSETFCNGTVWVLDRMRVETLTSLAESLHLQRETDVEGYEREVCFILLQLINCLKHLQVLGIEEVDATYGDFALIMKNNDVNYRLVILPKVSSASDGAYGTLSDGGSVASSLSLCQTAISAMLLLLNAEPAGGGTSSAQSIIDIPAAIPLHEAFGKIARVLEQERATSLSQAKLLLEYLLWGPAELQGDLQPTGNGVDQEQAYQRWLDLERATVLNNLIRTQSLWQIRLTVFEEYMLSFLVRTCAKTLREAAGQLQRSRSKLL